MILLGKELSRGRVKVPAFTPRSFTLKMDGRRVMGVFLKSLKYDTMRKELSTFFPIYQHKHVLLAYRNYSLQFWLRFHHRRRAMPELAVGFLPPT
mmetsp:Transcript_18214/g.27541  ORF Transcript_18214/g.27541 Transcript_18214/m.27541 type:complete len:95 (-) Transcript_18214:1631-1915(-)